MFKLIALITMFSGASGIEDINRQDIYCLSHAVYHEAGAEPIEGQIAVAHVVLNRVRDSRYPDSVCEVVYQPYQFTGLYRQNFKFGWYQESAVEAALMAYTGLVEDPTGGAINYYAWSGPNALKQDPWPEMTVLADIGNHRFKCGEWN